MIICKRHESELDLQLRRWGLTPLIPKTRSDTAAAEFNPEEMLRKSAHIKASREVPDFLFGTKCPLCLIKDTEFLNEAARHLAVHVATIIGKH